MVNLLFNKRPVIILNGNLTYNEILWNIHHHLGLNTRDYYLLHNGKILKPDFELRHENFEIVLRTYGGKGGFGSMLRAIGAQIEKTTNREACRDLSGRRLRDINEEKRLKKWITEQAERGKEAAERKQKKLEKLCETPKHEFKDKHYDNERSQLPDIIENAVTQGLRATCSNESNKRKSNDDIKNNKKRRKLWIDDIDVSSDDGEISDNESDNPSNSTENSGTNSLDNVDNPLPTTKEEHHMTSSEKEDVICNKINNFQEKKEIQSQT